MVIILKFCSLESLKWVSLSENQGTGRATSLSESSEGEFIAFPFSASKSHLQALACWPSSFIFKATAVSQVLTRPHSDLTEPP